MGSVLQKEEIGVHGQFQYQNKYHVISLKTIKLGILLDHLILIKCYELECIFDISEKTWCPHF